MSSSAKSGIFWIQPRASHPADGFSKFIFVGKTLIFNISNRGRIENIHFDEVSGDASRPLDYANRPKNNQKGPGLNHSLLGVGFQSHHIPLPLEGSSAVEVPGVISDDVPGTTSSNSPMFSS